MKALIDGNQIVIVKDNFKDLQNDEAVFIKREINILLELNKLFGEERLEIKNVIFIAKEAAKKFREYENTWRHDIANSSLDVPQTAHDGMVNEMHINREMAERLEKALEPFKEII